MSNDLKNDIRVQEHPASASRGCSPRRVQLSRRKGYKLPENTVNVARPGKWGNPFIVGKHGTRERCVELFRLLCGGYVCISVDSECGDAQQRFLKHAKSHITELRGKNLACWCPENSACHADVLLRLAHKCKAVIAR